jgi:nucleotide-binding universal stress UspA family protein
MSIVLGYDESPGARHALETAINLATKFDEPLVLVYAVAPPGRVGEEFQAHMAALTDIGRAATAHAVRDAEAAGVSTVVELVESKPAEGLVEVADRYDARFIVVGTWGDTPMRSAMVGSTPHKLLHLSARPVLCVPAAQ